MSEGTLTPAVGDEDHVQGSSDASVTLVEYGDYECSYCGTAFPIVQAAQRALGKRLRFVFRNFPLSEAHPLAERAAESAEAVADEVDEDAFWAMHDTLFENQDALSDRDLAKYAEQVGLDATTLDDALEAGTYRARVRSDFRSGVRSGVNGTPTFFVNGVRYDGDWSDTGGFIESLKRA